MPLRDHFHPPLSDQRHWESFHSRWINSIADALNEVLPESYFSEPESHAGVSLEIDVGTFRGSREDTSSSNGQPAGQSATNGATAVATLPRVFLPGTPHESVKTAFSDDFEIRIFRESGGAKLVAAIELISPGNKDDAEARRTFATKCASYLHNSVAVIVIDTVTERSANLHDEIMPLVTSDTVAEMGRGALYAVSYRPILANGEAAVELWKYRFGIGDAIPTLPLWLNAVLAVPVELEATYTTALRRARIE
jgi:hypothetical protein